MKTKRKQIDSRIKGAILVCCIHVSMAIKEQTHSGIIPVLCCPHERSLSVPASTWLRRNEKTEQRKTESISGQKSIGSSRASYLSAAFTSAWCSRSRPTTESCPFSAAHMSAVSPFLQAHGSGEMKRQNNVKRNQYQDRSR